MVDEIEFEDIRCSIMIMVAKGSKDGLDELCDRLKATYRKEADYRSFIEGTIVCRLGATTDETSIEELREYLTLITRASRADLCTANAPIMLLNELFETCTSRRIEDLFVLVEENLDVWREDFFFETVKHELLRLCNNLLRKLSRYQETVIRERILQFLATFFPFFEKSGMCLSGESHGYEITEYNDQNSLDDNTLEEIILSTCDGDNAEYTLYDKFWKVQKYYLSCPENCFNKQDWNIFRSYTNLVLDSFKEIKVVEKDEKDIHTGSYGKNYSTRYPTSRHLFDSQLRDRVFRRCILTQFLMTFQCLESPGKFVPEGSYLQRDQLEWVKEATERVFDLIMEIPPDGAEYAKSVLHILKREQNWVDWKNEGCPKIKPPYSITEESETKSNEMERENRNLTENIKEAFADNQFHVGNPVLTSIWKKDNLEACRTKKRNFVPPLDSYLEGVLDQPNEESSTVPKFKDVHNPNYSWRALRLLARESPHFYRNSKVKTLTVPELLENMISKVLKEKEAEKKIELAGPNTARVVKEGQALTGMLREKKEEVNTPKRKLIESTSSVTKSNTE